MVEEFISVSSTVLGSISVPATSRFTFVNGLHGFEQLKEFVLVPGSREGLFWLQSLADQSIAFLLVDPFLVKEEYSVDLGPTEKRVLDVKSPDDVLLLAVVTLPERRTDMASANLRGPIVLNVNSARGCQTVVSDDSLGMQTPVDVLSLKVRVSE